MQFHIKQSGSSNNDTNESKDTVNLAPPPLPESVVKTNDNGKGGGRRGGGVKPLANPFLH